MSLFAIMVVNVIFFTAKNAAMELARYKPTKQSTNYFENASLSYLAANGDYTQWIEQLLNTCAHTSTTVDEPTWWAVDLGAIYQISNIVIFGRKDCCFYRLSNFNIDVIRPCRNKSSWFEDNVITLCHYQQDPITIVNATCPDETVGQYVRIQLIDREILSLCEVEVHGEFVGYLNSNTFPYTCGFQGHSYDNHDVSLGRVQVYSDIQCTYICAFRNDCHAADFNKKTLTCSLMNATSEYDAFMVNPEHNVFIVN